MTWDRPQLDKLPQISYALPDIKIGDTSLHFENSTTLVAFDKKNSTPPVTTNDLKDTRFDTNNKLIKLLLSTKNTNDIEFNNLVDDINTVRNLNKNYQMKMKN